MDSNILVLLLGLVAIFTYSVDWEDQKAPLCVVSAFGMASIRACADSGELVDYLVIYCTLPYLMTMVLLDKILKRARSRLHDME